MTGVFVVKANGKHLKDVEIIPQEILDEMYAWWETAKRGDKFEVECDIPA